MFLKSASCLILATAGAGLTAAGADPHTITACTLGIAGGLLSGGAGNTFHELLGDKQERLLAWVFRRHPGIDENHHILLALRQAHVKALGSVLDGCDEAHGGDWDEARQAASDRFSTDLRRFLKEAGAMKAGGPAAPSDLERAVFAKLPEGLEAALAARGTRPPASALNDAARVRRDIEAAVLAELVQATGTATIEKVPELFRRVFADPDLGWFPLFVRDAATRLKENAAFGVIFNHEQVARIRHQVDLIRPLVETIATDVTALRAEVGALTKLLLAGSTMTGGPPQAPAVATAVEAAVTGAEAGDHDLRQATDLLAAGRPAEAEPLFRAVAERTEERIRRDSKAAAAAYRNLGAIAGLSDPKRALDAYLKALSFDPDDLDSHLRVAWLHLDRGETAKAEARFDVLLNAAGADERPWHRYWGLTGLGDIAVTRGNLDKAGDLYGDAGNLAEFHSKADAGHAGWRRDLSVSFNKVGDVLVAQGNLPEALKSFRAGLAITERLAAADEGNAGWRRDLSVSFNKVGDVLVAQGNLPEALKSFRAGLAIAEHLAAADEGNAEWQRDLSVSYDRVGDVLVAQGNLPEALKSFRAGLAIAEHLAAADEGNAGWRRDLSVSFNKVGDVLVAQGHLPEALKSFRAGLAIAEHLAAADEGHAEWQRDLSVFFNKVGDVLVAQGNMPEALKSFRAGLTIAERLAAADVGNAEWQRDLSVPYDRMGDVLVAQGNLPEALKSFRAGLAIREQLAAADEGNAEWQRDLIVSCVKIAEIFPTEAAGLLNRARAIACLLRDEGRLAPRDAWIPDELERRIAALE